MRLLSLCCAPYSWITDVIRLLWHNCCALLMGIGSHGYVISPSLHWCSWLLAHVLETGRLQLRTSALFLPELLAQPQVHQLLEGVVAQDKRTVVMSAMVKTLADSSRPNTPKDSSQRRAPGRPSGAPPSKKPLPSSFRKTPAQGTRLTPQQS